MALSVPNMGVNHGGVLFLNENAPGTFGCCSPLQIDAWHRNCEGCANQHVLQNRLYEWLPSRPVEKSFHRVDAGNP
jgi:hypothetical protein